MGTVRLSRRKLHVAHSGLAGLSLVATVVVSARAQGIPVSAHFGALSHSTPDRIWEAGLVLDRFTDHTKRSDSLIAQQEPNRRDTKTRHYALRSTLGINAAYIGLHPGISISDIKFLEGNQGA